MRHYLHLSYLHSRWDVFYCEQFKVNKDARNTDIVAKGSPELWKQHRSTIEESG